MDELLANISILIKFLSNNDDKFFKFYDIDTVFHLLHLIALKIEIKSINDDSLLVHKKNEFNLLILGMIETYSVKTYPISDMSLKKKQESLLKILNIMKKNLKIDS